jgi:hypothetical protein
MNIREDEVPIPARFARAQTSAFMRLPRFTWVRFRISRTDRAEPGNFGYDAGGIVGRSQRAPSLRRLAPTLHRVASGCTADHSAFTLERASRAGGTDERGTSAPFTLPGALRVCAHGRAIRRAKPHWRAGNREKKFGRGIFGSRGAARR